MTIHIDPEVSKRLDEGMRGGESVELPFPVVYAWAMNGQTSYKNQGGALFYGGWAIKSETLRDVIEQNGNNVPAGWEEVNIGARDGSEFSAFVSRNVLVAPIGKRLSWVKDGVRLSEYAEGGRRHLQILAYMAEVETKGGKKVYQPWSPIVLTAKGYQANNLLDAFGAWEKITSTARREVAPGVPAWCFYAALGTFGKDRKVVNVGKPGSQSPITPISLYVPEEVTPKLVESLFVGSEIVGIMADILDQAKEWLEAWKATPGDKRQETEKSDYFDEETLVNVEDQPF